MFILFIFYLFNLRRFWGHTGSYNFSAWIFNPKSSQVTSKHITQKIQKPNQSEIPKQINPKSVKKKKLNSYTRLSFAILKYLDQI